MKKTTIALLFSALFLALSSHAQNKKIDSLSRIIDKCKVDTEKILKQSDLLRLCISSNDSTLFFTIYTKAYQLAEKNNFLHGKIILQINLATYYTYLLKKDSALKILGLAEDMAAKSNNKSYIVQVYHQYSVFYKWIDNYSTSLSYALKALKMSEIIRDTSNMSSCYGQIANIYLKQHNYSLAKDFYLKSYHYDTLLHDEENLPVTLSNIGLVYNDLKQRDSSIFYLKKALSLKRKQDNQRGVSNTLNILGATYMEWDKPKEALLCLEEALSIKRKIKEQRGTAISLINIGQVYERTQNYIKAIPYLQECAEIAQKLKTNELLLETYKSLSNCYAETNNPILAYQTHVLFSNLKDTVYNEESQKQINDMQTKYGFEKKEQENKLLQTQNKLSSETIKQQKLVSYFIVGGLVLALLFSFFIFRGLKAQRKANRIISKQKQEVEKQKHLVEEKNKEITDSITYAKRIQNAILPNPKKWQTLLPHSFVLYQPKDIVAGDFYWLEETHNYIYLAAADCTGHGVPGAMVSVVCSSALSKAVLEEKQTETHAILDATRRLVLEQLGKSEEKIRDGMDICLIRINKNNRKHIQYSGANRPLYISKAQGELQELKPDKQPIGQYENEKPFSQQELVLNENDTLYLLTDGYADQFGGDNNKKFSSKALKKLMTENAHKTIEEQCLIFTQAFLSWRNNIEQTDDVTFLGIQV
ncbi:MAG: tetratricopeptide repeat protein [Bacteroidetes bacterium]|nr:tetratricopeptide repeat protein [Bacteroidota bacterium]